MRINFSVKKLCSLYLGTEGVVLNRCTVTFVAVRLTDLSNTCKAKKKFIEYQNLNVAYLTITLSVPNYMSYVHLGQCNYNYLYTKILKYV
jgi:benzoyl-CoA reductase/2-hydroxyglutaryl-CoA dehydratase subunit BcrC/BadD/HgdB